MLAGSVLLVCAALWSDGPWSATVALASVLGLCYLVPPLIPLCGLGLFTWAPGSAVPYEAMRQARGLCWQVSTFPVSIALLTWFSWALDNTVHWDEKGLYLAYSPETLRPMHLLALAGGPELAAAALAIVAMHVAPRGEALDATGPTPTP